MSLIDVTSTRSLPAANAGILVVDVRTPAEFAAAHVPGAVNLPLDQVDAHLRRIVTDAGGEMLLVCQSGNRAERARKALADAGLAGVAVLDGGMNAWIAAGGPVARGHGRRRWALERQVRLVAGGIVLASVVAGVWIPAANAMAALIGGGLVVAAITDTCAMGMMLAKLPYNRSGDVEAAIARLRRDSVDTGS
ncbi:rhodanese-like domain-containing protein [Thermoactinospora rubra]|uniref:rhodanese-like domain-containing protein n=1 Tax=Thermoactinospora rubra TaxID=1088767 RepID=UPI000A11A403|nr:rhodanese-like domain-containing protein [Thermoactinospora rubra]